MKIAELEERGCRNRDDVAIRLSGNSQEKAWFRAMGIRPWSLFVDRGWPRQGVTRGCRVSVCMSGGQGGHRE